MQSVEICGTTVVTGAMAATVLGLTADATPAPAPATADLPGPATSSTGAATVQYVRTSDSCDTGAVVTVEPVLNARIAKVFPARDGKPAAVGVVVLTDTVTVRAWVGGRDMGSRQLTS